MSPAGDRDPVGTATEEAARLFVALLERAREHAAGAASAVDDDDPDSRSSTGHPVECRWCPLCQAMAFVRDTNPELRQQVVAAAAALAVAVRDLAETAARPPSRPREGASGRSHGVEPIDLDDSDSDIDGKPEESTWD